MHEWLRLLPKPDPQQNGVQRYLTTLAVAAVCLLFTLSVIPPDNIAAHFAVLFLPIVISSFYWGFGPGLIALCATSAAVDVFYLSPAGGLDVKDLPMVLSATIAYLVSGMVAASVGEIGGNSLATLEKELAFRKAARADMEKNEERLRIAEQVSSAGVWDWDVERGTVYWSDAYRRLIGYSLNEEPARDKWISSIHLEDRDVVLREIEELFQHRLHNWSTEYRIHTTAGKLRWISSRGQAFYDSCGRPSRMVGVDVDISTRKATAALIRGNEARMHLLLQCGRIGGWEWWPLESRLAWFDEYYDVLGLDRALLASFEVWISHVSPADRNRLRTEIQQLLAEPKDQFQMEYSFLGSDGIERRIQDRGTMVRDPDNLTLRFVGVGVDISERSSPSAFRTSEPDQLSRIPAT